MVLTIIIVMINYSDCCLCQVARSLLLVSFSRAVLVGALRLPKWLRARLDHRLTFSFIPPAATSRERGLYSNIWGIESAYVYKLQTGVWTCVIYRRPTMFRVRVCEMAMVPSQFEEGAEAQL